MSRMNCPRCAGSELTERPRDGILIDVCPDCRGIWLDRGELDKLIARASREAEDGWRDDDDHDEDVPRGRGRKRRWFESFGDIFD